MPRPSLPRREKPARLLTRPPLERMQRIFHALKQGGFPNRIRLATDIEVNIKTIQRDIDFMRDRLSLPIVFDTEKGGYHFEQPVGRFPIVELNEAEVISVYVAQKALTQYKGTPFEHPLRNAFEKLTSSLDGKITLAWSDLDSLISFRSFDIAPLELATFQAVSEAVQKSLALEFEYKGLEATKFQRRLIEPYHLACILNQWYCFAHDTEKRVLRTFVLARMRKTVVTAHHFPRPQNFSIEQHLKDSFGVFSAKGSHTVRIQFKGMAAQLVRERHWHPSQKIQELTGGELEITLTLSSLAEIEPWVLSWGANARVLAPKELVQRIRQTAQALLRSS